MLCRFCQRVQLSCRFPTEAEWGNIRRWGEKDGVTVSSAKTTPTLSIAEARGTTSNPLRGEFLTQRVRAI